MDDVNSTTISTRTLDDGTIPTGDLHCNRSSTERNETRLSYKVEIKEQKKLIWFGKLPTSTGGEFFYIIDNDCSMNKHRVISIFTSGV